MLRLLVRLSTSWSSHRRRLRAASLARVRVTGGRAGWQQIRRIERSNPYRLALTEWVRNGGAAVLRALGDRTPGDC
jgi:hypothetical protein